MSEDEYVKRVLCLLALSSVNSDEDLVKRIASYHEAGVSTLRAAVLLREFMKP